MLPYIQLGALHIGSRSIYPYGILVLTGIIAGTAMLVWRAGRLGLDRNVAFRLCAVTVFCGIVGAHLLRVLFFQPSLFSRDPSVLLHISRGGLYSFGGLAGGIAGGLCFLRLSNLGAATSWDYFDLLAFSFPFGWIFGRAGCAVAHDHPGIRAYNWLSVNFPGGSRYDLGLLEFFFTIPAIVLFLWLDRRRRPAGFYLGLGLIIAGTFRIFLDGLHEPGAPRFLLTPDQAWGLLATVAGVVILAKVFRRPKSMDSRRFE
jgi:phosphatidylglycerol:prolipoprotein diacylglycerol transferase